MDSLGSNYEIVGYKDCKGSAVTHHSEGVQEVQNIEPLGYYDTHQCRH